MSFKPKHTIGNKHNMITFNIILWLFFFCALLFVFSDYPIEKIDLIYTVSYLITLVPPVLLGLYFFIPKFLKKGKNILFLIIMVTSTLLFALLNIYFHDKFIDFLFPDYYFISYLRSSQTVLLFITIVFLSLFIRLAEDWVYFNQKEKATLQLELSVLKNQINPHFLFNALNVLYSLSIKNKEETTQAILQLSDILRYGIYDTDNEKILLSKEIDLVKSFIAFEKNRSAKNADITFEYLFEKDQEIPPMLLLPLIENAFKHGIKSGVQKPYVHINLEEKNNVLFFQITNNFLRKNDNNDYSGIGLENVKKRLDILFFKKHDFKMTTQNTKFNISLNIEL